MPSNAKATVASVVFLNSKSAKDLSLEICADIQGSGVEMTFSPLSWRLKKLMILSSVADGGRL